MKKYFFPQKYINLVAPIALIVILYALKAFFAIFYLPQKPIFLP